MVKKILDNKYVTGLGGFVPGDKIAIQSQDYWEIYRVEKTVPSDWAATTAIQNGYLSFLQEIEPLLYNVITDKNPTPENGAEVPGVKWYNYKTNETFTLQNKLIEDKFVWISDKGTMICADTSRIVDFFRDGSAKFLYEFNDNLADSGGLYDLKSKFDMKYEPGLVGKCAKFTNKNYCYTDIKFNNAKGTVSLWANPRQPYGAYGCLFHLSQNGDNYFSIWVHKNMRKWYIIQNNRDFYGPAVKWNKWSHLAFTTDGKFYVNGELVLSTGLTSDLTKVRLPMLVGADRDSRTAINDWYKGNLEELRFFEKECTTNEIKLLYNEMAKYV